MTLGEFEEIVKMSKQLKSELIYTIGNKMYGMDNGITIYIKEMTVNNFLPTLVFTYKDWYDIFADLNNKGIKYKDKELVGDHITYEKINHYFYSLYMINIIEDKLNKVRQHLAYNRIVVSVPNVVKDENFSPIMDKKYTSADGVIMYKLSNHHCISIYKTLLGLTSKQYASLDVFENPWNMPQMMCRFIIFEKSKPPINMYINTRIL